MGPNETAAPAPRKRTFSRRTTIMVLLVLGAAVVVVGPFLDAISKPWSISLTGGKTLTGTWNGQIRVAPGDVRGIAVELTVNHYSRCRNCKGFHGRAAICTPAWKALLYEISGNPRDSRGTRFTFNAYAEQAPPGRHLRDLGQVEGTWDKADTVKLRVLPGTMQLTDTGEVMTVREEVRFELKRADAFRPTCGRDLTDPAC